MEERVNNLENDYLAFIADIGAQVNEHGRLLRVMGRDVSELRARATVSEIRASNLDEKLAEMQEEMRQGFARMDAQFAQILGLLRQQQSNE